MNLKSIDATFNGMIPAIGWLQIVVYVSLLGTLFLQFPIFALILAISGFALIDCVLNLPGSLQRPPTMLSDINNTYKIMFIIISALTGFLPMVGCLFATSLGASMKLSCYLQNKEVDYATLEHTNVYMLLKPIGIVPTEKTVNSIAVVGLLLGLLFVFL